jgi:hypothetical protein
MASPRPCLCRFFSEERTDLIRELQSAMLSGPLSTEGTSASARGTNTIAGTTEDRTAGGCVEQRIRMLLVSIMKEADPRSGTPRAFEGASIHHTPQTRSRAAAGWLPASANTDYCPLKCIYRISAPCPSPGSPWHRLRRIRHRRPRLQGPCRLPECAASRPARPRHRPARWPRGSDGGPIGHRSLLQPRRYGRVLQQGAWTSAPVVLGTQGCRAEGLGSGFWGT